MGNVLLTPYAAVNWQDKKHIDYYRVRGNERVAGVLPAVASPPTVRVDDRATVWRWADLDWTAARPSGYQRALDAQLPALTADTPGSVTCNRMKAQLSLSRSDSSPSQPCAFTSRDFDRATHRTPAT